MKTSTFRHRLIIKTLSAHFSSLTQGQPVRGIMIGQPQLSLALATAAVIPLFSLATSKLIFDYSWQVEHALQLFANEMVEE